MTVANYSTNGVDAHLYVVCEGEVYTVKTAPAYLTENNWLSDWIFVAAENESKALEVAEKTDSSCNKRTGRVYTKYCRLQEERSKLMAGDEASTVEKILALTSACVFNQSYVLGSKKQ